MNYIFLLHIVQLHQLELENILFLLYNNYVCFEVKLTLKQCIVLLEGLNRATKLR